MLRECLVATAILASGVALAADETKPGEGVLCALVGYAIVEQAIVVCRSDDLPIYGAVHRVVAKLKDYVIRNSPDSDTAARLQSWQGSPPTDLERIKAVCDETRPLFVPGPHSLLNQDPAELERAVDQLTSRDGMPTYGQVCM